MGLRPSFYERFATARTAGTAEEALRDIADRCRRAPDEVISMATLTRLRLRARRLGLDKVALTTAALIRPDNPRHPVGAPIRAPRGQPPEQAPGGSGPPDHLVAQPTDRRLPWCARLLFLGVILQ